MKNRQLKPSEVLNLYRRDIRRIVESHHAGNPRIFGSVLHASDTKNSDLDLLVEPTSEMTLMDIGAIRYELHKLLGIKVDVVTPKALSERWRKTVLSEAVLL